jgi:hypothetical protein
MTKAARGAAFDEERNDALRRSVGHVLPRQERLSSLAPLRHHVVVQRSLGRLEPSRPRTDAGKSSTVSSARAASCSASGRRACPRRARGEGLAATRCEISRALTAEDADEAGHRPRGTSVLCSRFPSRCRFRQPRTRNPPAARGMTASMSPSGRTSGGRTGRRSSLRPRSLPCAGRAHSSSGLGRRPLTAVARVRIPYAPPDKSPASAGFRLFRHECPEAHEEP